MPRAGFLLLLLGGVAACGDGGPATGSALRFAAARTDLGTIFQYDEVPFALPFAVEGDAPVRIDLLDTSCGCTDVRLVVDGETLLWAERKGGPAQQAGGGEEEGEEEDESLTAKADRLIELPPGARGEVIGTFRAERRLGERIVAVTLAGSMLNSPSKAEIRTTILPVFEVAKDAGNFGTVQQTALLESGVAREIEVRAPRPFQVRQWRDVPDGIAIEAIGEAEPAGLQVLQRLRVRMLPHLAVGPPKLAQVSGETDLGRPLVLTLSWRVVGPAIYAPDHRLQFMGVTNARDHVQQVKIRPSDAGRNLPEPRLEILGEAAAVLEAAIEPLAATATEPAGWLARLRLPQGTAAGVYNGTLSFSYPEGSGIATWTMVVHARVQEAR